MAGAPTGLAGGAWAGPNLRRRMLSVAFLAGILLAEAIARFVEVEGWTGIDMTRTALQVAAVDLAAAVAAPLVLSVRGNGAPPDARAGASASPAAS